jgi:phosphoribosylanthranilate isomerase
MIQTITFTGASDSTNPQDLIDISEKYPFVEWGILVPTYKIGRFPSKEWLENLVKVTKDTSVRLSGHFCEPWVEHLLIDGNYINDIKKELGTEVFNAFKRIQINFHGIEYTGYSTSFEKMMADHKDKEFILQADGVNNWISTQVKAPNASILVDKSSGAGIFNNVWPSFNKKKFGYAGGLNIETLPIAMKTWIKTARDIPWIDIESGIMEEEDGNFSIPRVTEVIEYMNPYIFKGMVDG